MKTEYKMNLLECCYIPTLIWAVINIDVHTRNNKEVFASIVYVICQPVISKGLTLK